MTENEIAYKIVGALLELHKNVGPGLLESAYEHALAYDLRALGLDKNSKLHCRFTTKK